MDPGQSLQDLGYVQATPTDPGWDESPQAKRAAGPPGPAPQPQGAAFRPAPDAHHVASQGPTQAAMVWDGSPQQRLGGGWNEHHKAGLRHAVSEAPEADAGAGWGDEDDGGYMPHDAFVKPSGDKLHLASSIHPVVVCLMLPVALQATCNMLHPFKHSHPWQMFHIILILRPSDPSICIVRRHPFLRSLDQHKAVLTM